MKDNLAIGHLAAMTGVKVPTIRFYEEIRLLPPAIRTEGGQRRYGAQTAKRLIFIRHARKLGFDIEEIRALLKLADLPDASCEAIDAIARQQVRRIDGKIKRLDAMRRELTAVIRACRGPRVRDCRIIDVLSRPAAA